MTDAPPQVEVFLGTQAQGKTVVHLVNYSGHQDRSFHAPLEIRDIAIELRSGPSGAQAYSARLDETLPMQPAEGGVRFVLPRLGLFDSILLD